MKSILVAALFTLVSSLSMAAGFTGSVKCWVEGKYSAQDSVALKMKNGSLTYWSKTSVARPDAKSIFGLFSEPIEEGAIESVRFSQAKNGYALVTIFTTAESITVGVSSDLTKGFWRYLDHGSGNGNDSLELSCQRF